MAEWNNSDKFSGLIKSNKKFLKGEISSSPYHYGPIEAETRSLVPSLLKLHERQIFTWNSQPYLRERTRREGGSFYDSWQRPYLSFVVAEKNNPQRLFKELKRNKDIKVHAGRVSSPEIALDGSFTKNKIVSKDRIVTKYRRSLFLRRWKAFTSVNPTSDIAEEDIFCLEAMKQAKPWVFDVVAASWKDVDIARILIDAADAVYA